MKSNNKPKEFFEKLKKQLYETSSWPSNYLFKFIVNTDPLKIQKIQTIFDQKEAIINLSSSKNGKYSSVSINVKMNKPEDVIIKYKEVIDNVEGVISL
tara:strand:- start:4146 stop:4439 length:294 start_codon:yes stop_codon:yes gene_type:complete